jgi:cbb3-type cytochrome oxidase subunit 3
MLPIVFPENKLEYIPAFITLAIFMIFAWRTVVFFQKHHRKELQKAKALEEELMSKELKNKDI